MIPRIARRGHSFIGCSKYYLHDKGSAKTSNRVAWTHTINLPTNDPQTAFKCMAFTVMHADILKQKSGIVRTGRKNINGAVYSFSLSWHPQQNPDQDTMLMAAYEALERLDLQEHESIIVAHNDCKHKHIHIVTCLVHPETGKICAPSYDRLTLSTWAEEMERMDNNIVCPQRVINNELRRNNARHDRQLALVKYKEKQLDIADEIQQLYNQFDTGLAFQSALKTKGYILAKGDRRGFVLIDKNEKVYSLSRQLKGQWAKDIKKRLQDIITELPDIRDTKRQAILVSYGLKTILKNSAHSIP